KEFDFQEFPTGTNAEQIERVEGQKTYLRYMLKEGAKDAGKIQIVRNYVNAIEKIGGAVVGTSDDAATLKVMQNGREVWAYIDPYDNSYDITIVERKAMKQDVTAGKLLEELQANGHVAL